MITLTLTITGGLIKPGAQTFAGTIDVADAGLTVSIFDDTTLLATVTPAADGTWSKQVVLSTPGLYDVYAWVADGTGGTIGSQPTILLVASDLTAPVLPLNTTEMIIASSVLADFTGPYTFAITDTADNVAGNATYVQYLIASGHIASITRIGIAGQAYTSYEEDYQGTGYVGSRYFFTNVVGQPYTGYEQDIDPAGHLTRILFTGVGGQAYSSFEYDYASNGAIAGSKYFYTKVTGQPYTGYEFDVDLQNRVTRYAFTGVIGQAYSAFEYDYDAGVLTGTKYFFTNVTGQPFTGYEIDFDASNLVSRYAFAGVIGQSYSAYEYDYRLGFFAGSKYFFTNVTGQAYSGYEIDLDPLNRVTKYAFTGVSGQAYTAYEYDYDGGFLAGAKYYFTGIAGQSYTGFEIDIDAQNQVTRYAFTGISSQAYTAYEYDYAQGVLTGSKYLFTGITGQSYSSYEVDLNASGGLAMQIQNSNDGGHRIQGFQDNLTLNSIANDTMTGGGSSETFAFTPGFAQDVITDFAAHLTGIGHDTLRFSTAQFADAAAVIAHAADVGGNAVISATNGDTLTLMGVTTAQLAANTADFKFA